MWLLLVACCATIWLCWISDIKGQQRAAMDVWLHTLPKFFEMWFRRAFMDPVFAGWYEALHELLADPKLFDGIETPWCKPHWTYVDQRLWRLTTGEPVMDLPWIDLCTGDEAVFAQHLPYSLWSMPIIKRNHCCSLDFSA